MCWERSFSPFSPSLRMAEGADDQTGSQPWGWGGSVGLSTQHPNTHTQRESGCRGRSARHLKTVPERERGYKPKLGFPSEQSDQGTQR